MVPTPYPELNAKNYSQRGRRLWYLDHGSRSLKRSDHCNTVVVRWTVREHGIALAGPAPATLVDPIPVEVLRQEIMATIRDWGQEILDEPERFNNRFYQTFIVLSYCRMLHDLHTGSTGSKRAGARWAQATLDPSWAGLIDRAWDGRPNPALSVRQPADPASAPSASVDRCPDCGAPASGGRAGCQALFDELAAQAFTDLRYAPVYMLAFDTYCMQHLDTYCRSAKSYAAHLTRLCCGLEYEGHPEVYAAIQKWLNGAPGIQKPETLSFLGQMTVADVRAARDVEEHKRLVQDWARSVWAAYAAQHEMARQWIEAALLPTSFCHLLKEK